MFWEISLHLRVVDKNAKYPCSSSRPWQSNVTTFLSRCGQALDTSVTSCRTRRSAFYCMWYDTQRYLYGYKKVRKVNKCCETISISWFIFVVILWSLSLLSCLRTAYICSPLRTGILSYAWIISWEKLIQTYCSLVKFTLHDICVVIGIL